MTRDNHTTPTGVTQLEPCRFWLLLREPGCVPERKGPWFTSQSAEVLREFIKTRPTAYIDYITVGDEGEPYIEHGPEVLQLLDGRSMGVGRKHNKRVSEAEDARPSQSGVTQAEKAWEGYTRWLCKPQDVRNEERPWIVGFNAGWDECTQSTQPYIDALKEAVVHPDIADALEDALLSLRVVRNQEGSLNFVFWDRVEQKLLRAISLTKLIGEE